MKVFPAMVMVSPVVDKLEEVIPRAAWTSGFDANDPASERLLYERSVGSRLLATPV